MSKVVYRQVKESGPAHPVKQSVVNKPSALQLNCGDDVDDPGTSEDMISDDPQDLTLAAARASLANALESRKHFEARVENIRSSLMIAREQIPTLDQSDLSMLQDAYLNASTAFSVASEKALIWQQRVNRFSMQDTVEDDSDKGIDDWPMAA